MSRLVDEEPQPGGWTASKAWKVCACLPLVLLCAALAVKGVDRLTVSEPAAAPAAEAIAPQQQVAIAEVGMTRTLGPDARQRQKRKAADAPTSEEPTTSAPATQDSQPDPTRKPSPSGTPSSPASGPPSSQAPKPTPTPEQAAEACERAGVNPLDTAAMAACIAKALEG